MGVISAGTTIQPTRSFTGSAATDPASTVTKSAINAPTAHFS